MIVESNGKALAFGLRWQAIIGGQAPGAKARELGSAWFWSDPTGEYVGGLPAGVAVPRKARMYAAAQALRRARPGTGSLLAILKLPDQYEGYAVIGLIRGRPRAGFDRERVEEEELADVVSNFLAATGDEGFALLGDAPLPDIHALTLAEVADAADESCVLRKVPRRVNTATLGLTALLIVIAVAGVRYYQEYREHQLALERERAQKSPVQLYAAAMAAAALVPVAKVTDLDDWFDWVTGLPREVGGWYFRTADCESVPDTQKLSCTLSFARSDLPLVTNQTFLDAMPPEWPDASVSFDPSGKRIRVSVDRAIHMQPTSTILNAMPDARTVEVVFRSQLQSLERVAKGSGTFYGDLQIFGLPSGVSAGDVPSPVFSAKWDFAGPARDLEAVRTFPPYLSVEHVVFSYAESATLHDLETSVGTVDISGQLFAKK